MVRRSVAALIVLLLAGLSFNAYLDRSPHRPISARDVVGVRLWRWVPGSGMTETTAAADEAAKIIDWFNSATEIRPNRSFAGTTAECGIRVILTRGRSVLILKSGADFEVQRDYFLFKRVSYWARQDDVRRLLERLIACDSPNSSAGPAHEGDGE
ncbi:MAG: hypothetical protein HPY55_13895 [Firmicutes bacterium]|nr:hypothetical protein [Bacillota bacterium]